MTNLTQEQLILSELKKAGSMGLHPTYLIESLHVFQYNRAINTIRKWFNCECKNGVHCISEEHIINRRLPDGTTKFFDEKSEREWEKMRVEAIQEIKRPEAQLQSSLF